MGINSVFKGLNWEVKKSSRKNFKNYDDDDDDDDDDYDDDSSVLIY